ncbi:alpha/beta hydrolase [Pseudoalteromonas sp. T1lg23B]|uniref:alpha/beta hydrolase n=1 Tax=Pseudoalteromonas sp. T1lg23B TaxID=2077097 RepID=UPI000CF607B2|nr:alpha/beta hydrolase-fold protein [Pseudoalteromonas sp. T1lg23B]
MFKVFLLVILLLQPLLVINAEEHSSYVMPKTHVVALKDSDMEYQYELLIKLPEEYQANKHLNYPVIYFTDAVWHIETLSGISEFLFNDVILVGISWQKDNHNPLLVDEGEHASRFRDYTIRTSSNAANQAKYKFGQAQQHLAFINRDVFQYVEKHYRTDPSKRTYFGYSLGGLFGAYALMSQPDTFQNYILGSPSLRNNLTKLESAHQRITAKQRDTKINVFIAHGTLEQDRSKLINDFVTTLKTKHSSPLNITNIVVAGDHQSAFPATAVQSLHWLANLKYATHP